jgi:hypothetical protein
MKFLENMHFWENWKILEFVSYSDVIVMLSPRGDGDTNYHGGRLMAWW